MSRKEGKTRAIFFGICAKIGRKNAGEGRNLQRGSFLPRMGKKASMDSKHAKIVKTRVNGDRNQVNLEKYGKVCLERKLHRSGSLLPRTGRRKRSRYP